MRTRTPYAHLVAAPATRHRSLAFAASMVLLLGSLGCDRSPAPPAATTPSSAPHLDAVVTDAAPPARAACAPPAPAATNAFLRANQVGYRPADPKHLRLLSAATVGSKGTFVVRGDDCKVVLEGAIGADLGAWNAAYPHVYDVDVSTLKAPGRYAVEAAGAPAVITIGPGSALYAPLLANARFFYEAQHDGADVDAHVLARKPSHLADREATVYALPKGAEARGKLTRTGGPVDVSGGWFDAGDYLKFVETASYADAVLFLAARDHAALAGPGTAADFQAEAKFGLTWLRKMWNDKTRTLLIQVGLGEGDPALEGDHDEWRLPEADDAMDVKPGDPRYFVRNRPAYQAGPPGSKISPNLAGRLAADFALCSQVLRATDAPLADECLAAAEHVFAKADTKPAHLVTTTPYEFYGETHWRDDLELGATEIYWALSAASPASLAALPEKDPAFYLKQAATWASAVVAEPVAARDSLNLYDVSALAHYELHRALTRAGGVGMPIAPQALLADLEAQVKRGADRAQADPFGFGPAYGEHGSDAIPHALGLAVSAEFYGELSGDPRYAPFAAAQRDFILGANAWGTSFVVGAGTLFPACPQHQIANLVGSLDGSPPVLLGAIPDGPSPPRNLKKTEGLQKGMRACPPDGADLFAPFDGHDAAYEDNTIDWATSEPADDYVALSVLLFARQARP